MDTVRCVTCGRVISWFFKYFQRRRKELLGSERAAPILERGVQPDEKALGKVLDELGLDLICCRRHLLSHVDLTDMI
jgi:DNA-directed RNA polymerase subunit N (RpoN/RPB10)